MKYEVICPEENKSEIIEESDLQVYHNKGYQVLNSIPETVADKDYLNEHSYPGHETKDYLNEHSYPGHETLENKIKSKNQ